MNRLYTVNIILTHSVRLGYTVNLVHLSYIWNIYSARFTAPYTYYASRYPTYIYGIMQAWYLCIYPIPSVFTVPGLLSHKPVCFHIRCTVRMQYTVIVPGVSRVKRHAGISIFHSRVCVFVHDRAVDVFLPAFFSPAVPSLALQLRAVGHCCIWLLSQSEVSH